MDILKKMENKVCSACSGSGCYCSGKCGACNGTGLEYSKDDILEEYKKLTIKANNKIDNLKDTIKRALAIESLWLPATVDIEHEDEAKALHMTRALFLEAIK